MCDLCMHAYICIYIERETNYICSHVMSCMYACARLLLMSVAWTFTPNLYICEFRRGERVCIHARMHAWTHIYMHVRTYVSIIYIYIYNLIHRSEIKTKCSIKYKAIQNADVRVCMHACIDACTAKGTNGTHISMQGCMYIWPRSYDRVIENQCWITTPCSEHISFLYWWIDRWTCPSCRLLNR